MNYKRAKPHTNKRIKRKQLNGRTVKGWEYSGRIAREVVSRREFRSFKYSVLKGAMSYNNCTFEDVM